MTETPLKPKEMVGCGLRVQEVLGSVWRRRRCKASATASMVELRRGDALLVVVETTSTSHK